MEGKFTVDAHEVLLHQLDASKIIPHIPPRLNSCTSNRIFHQLSDSPRIRLGAIIQDERSLWMTWATESQHQFRGQRIPDSQVGGVRKVERSGAHL